MRLRILSQQNQKFLQVKICVIPLPLCPSWHPEDYLARSQRSVLNPVTSGSTVGIGLGRCTDGVFCYSPFGQTYCFVDFFPFSPKILGHPQAILKDYKWLIRIPALSCAAAYMTFNNSYLIIWDGKQTHWSSIKQPALHTHLSDGGPFGVLEIQNNKCLWSAYCVPGTVPEVALGTQR